MMGGHTAGIIGFSELNAGLQGAQAEFVRVPIADVNLLQVPNDSNLTDEKVLLLSDILCTAWFGTELANVSQGDVVAIWGAGPVGQLAAECSFARGAKRVIMVDNVKDRLEFARRMNPKTEIVDFSQDSTSSAGEKQVLELCKNEVARAPDCCIEAVGMHYAHSFIHRVEMMAGLETDTPEALNAAIFACKKGGRIGSIGAYVGFANHFNIGTMMMKNITLASGQVPVQKYWNHLLDMIRRGEIHPEKIITHRMKLDQAPQAYKMFNDKEDGCIKVLLTPNAAPVSETAKST
jgi:threonine dehydrogenase-like Zn-dependent dehydrogenase